MEELTYKNLFKDFIEFQKEFKGMTPDAQNPFFKSSYITLDGILETVRPILSKHGLCVLQEATGDGEYIFVKTKLAHVSGEILETDILKMKPQKNDPQSMGSCITYAKRYQLAALLGICESVDDDGNKATYPDKTPQSKENKVYKCVHCEKEVTEKIAKFSYGKFKKILCLDCQKKVK